MASAFEKAYLKIRELITSGELVAGDPLIPDDLAKLCGVSRTPVREAIFRLEAEMFVTRLDNKRTIVRAWAPGEIDVFIELCVRIEGLVAAQAAVNIDADALDELDDLNDRHAALLERGGTAAELLELNKRFYAVLIAATGSARLETISYQLANPAPLIRQIERQTDQDTADAQAALNAHRELVAACAARDPRWAEATMVALLRRTYRPEVLARLTAD